MSCWLSLCRLDICILCSRADCSASLCICASLSCSPFICVVHCSRSCTDACIDLFSWPISRSCARMCSLSTASRETACSHVSLYVCECCSELRVVLAEQRVFACSLALPDQMLVILLSSVCNCGLCPLQRVSVLLGLLLECSNGLVFFVHFSLLPLSLSMNESSVCCCSSFALLSFAMRARMRAKSVSLSCGVCASSSGVPSSTPTSPSMRCPRSCSIARKRPWFLFQQLRNLSLQCVTLASRWSACRSVCRAALAKTRVFPAQHLVLLRQLANPTLC